MQKSRCFWGISHQIPLTSLYQIFWTWYYFFSCIFLHRFLFCWLSSFVCILAFILKTFAFRTDKHAKTHFYLASFRQFIISHNASNSLYHRYQYCRQACTTKQRKLNDAKNLSLNWNFQFFSRRIRAQVLTKVLIADYILARVYRSYRCLSSNHTNFSMFCTICVCVFF